MNKKKLVSVIFLTLVLLVGIYLLFDKLFFHILFKYRPGSCLILEEKYCQTGKLVYKEDNTISWIVYQVPVNTKLFSPVSNHFSVIKGDSSNLFIFGNQDFDTGDNTSHNWFRVSFKGNILVDYNNQGIRTSIKKGNIFGSTIKNSAKTTEVYLTIQDVSFDGSELHKTYNQSEMLKIFNSSKNK